jgi:hypothetical protein
MKDELQKILQEVVVAKTCCSPESYLEGLKKLRIAGDAVRIDPDTTRI